MKAFFGFVMFGVFCYAFYSLWSDPAEFRNRVSGWFGNAPLPVTQPSAPQPENTIQQMPAVSVHEGVMAVVQDAKTYAYSNMGSMLAPITSDFSNANVGQLSQLKVRISTEGSRPHTEAERLKLQTALQLVSVMDQVFVQRMEHIRQRKSSEYSDGIEGTSTSTRRAAPITAEELDKRIKKAEFFKRGVERKWDDAAILFRTKIERLLVALSS